MNFSNLYLLFFIHWHYRRSVYAAWRRLADMNDIHIGSSHFLFKLFYFLVN